MPCRLMLGDTILADRNVASRIACFTQIPSRELDAAISGRRSCSALAVSVIAVMSCIGAGICCSHASAYYLEEQRNEGTKEARSGLSKSDLLTQRAVAIDGFLEKLASSVWRTRSLKSTAARVGTNAIRQQALPDDVKEKSNSEI